MTRRPWAFPFGLLGLIWLAMVALGSYWIFTMAVRSPDVRLATVALIVAALWFVERNKRTRPRGSFYGSIVAAVGVASGSAVDALLRGEALDKVLFGWLVGSAPGVLLALLLFRSAPLPRYYVVFESFVPGTDRLSLNVAGVLGYQHRSEAEDAIMSITIKENPRIVQAINYIEAVKRYYDD